MECLRKLLRHHLLLLFLTLNCWFVCLCVFACLLALQVSFARAIGYDCVCVLLVRGVWGAFMWEGGCVWVVGGWCGWLVVARRLPGCRLWSARLRRTDSLKWRLNRWNPRSEIEGPQNHGNSQNLGANFTLPPSFLLHQTHSFLRVLTKTKKCSKNLQFEIAKNA